MPDRKLWFPSIVAGCQRSFRGATLLLLESVVPPGTTPHFAKLLDLDVLLFVEGRERTEREFSTLLAQSGFTMSRVIPTMSNISLVEATVSEES